MLVCSVYQEVEELSATNRETLLKAKEIGYPVMIKAAAGGGGRGISIVHEENDLIPKMRLTQQEALNSFGSDEIYLRNFLIVPDISRSKFWQIILEMLFIFTKGIVLFKGKIKNC